MSVTVSIPISISAIVVAITTIRNVAVVRIRVRKPLRIIEKSSLILLSNSYETVRFRIRTTLRVRRGRRSRGAVKSDAHRRAARPSDCANGVSHRDVLCMRGMGLSLSHSRVSLSLSFSFCLKGKGKTSRRKKEKGKPRPVDFCPELNRHTHRARAGHETIPRLSSAPQPPIRNVY